MDAHAHLISLGWAGPGHALDSRPANVYKQKGKRGLDYDPEQVTNTGLGLVQPLMISQRNDRFGLGRKDPKHEPVAGKEWWLKNFETALGNLGKSESERSSTAMPVHDVHLNGQKLGGLYGFFIKGQRMEGTIGDELLNKSRESRKRKSDQISDVRPIGEKEGPPGRRDTRDENEEQPTRTKKPGAPGESQKPTQSFEARSSTRHKRKSEVKSADTERTVDMEGPARTETKEERRKRRRKRKEEKAAKKSSLAATAASGRGAPNLPQDDTSKRKRKDKLRARETH